MLTEYINAETRLLQAELRPMPPPWAEWQRDVVHAQWLKLTDEERATVLRQRRAAAVWDAHCGGAASETDRVAA
jgi:hypothetical protein